MECCDKECFTPFCPQCGQPVATDGRIAILKKMASYRRSQHRKYIKRTAHAETEWKEYPQYAERARESAVQHGKAADALEEAIVALMEKLQSDLEQKGGGDE